MSFERFYLLLSLVSMLAHTFLKNNAAICIFKVLPIALAILHVQFSRIADQDYKRKISVALLASALGDVFIVYLSVYVDALVYGIVFFILTHLTLVTAFGLQPFVLPRFLIVVAAHVAAMIVLKEPLLAMATNLQVLIAIYAFLLIFMVWRAVEKGGYCKLGAISFITSDLILSLTEVAHIIPVTVVPLRLSNILVLSTYYLSQYCFVKSVFNN